MLLFVSSMCYDSFPTLLQLLQQHCWHTSYTRVLDELQPELRNTAQKYNAICSSDACHTPHSLYHFKGML
jgi:hypothetical protein